MLRNTISLGIFVSLAALTGCGDSTTNADAAAVTEAGTVDSGPVTAGDGGTRRDAGGASTGGTCAAPSAFSGDSYTGNLGGGAGSLELGCNSTMNPRPQDVVAITVPGTGSQEVFVSLANPGTSETLDTVMELRTDCATDNIDTCNDDAVPGSELRSASGILANGGDTIYAVVTLYGGDLGMGETSGPFELTVETAAPTPPTFTSATVTRLAAAGENGGTQFVFSINGADAGQDADIQFQFLNAAGDPVDLLATAGEQVGPFIIGFDDQPAPATLTNALSTIELDPTLVGSVVSARVRLADPFQTSGEFQTVTVTIEAGTDGGTPAGDAGTVASDAAVEADAAVESDAGVPADAAAENG